MFCSLASVVVSGSCEEVVTVWCCVGNSLGILIGMATGGSWPNVFPGIKQVTLRNRDGL